ncbi:MAG: hypothetical protein AB7Q37_00035 [Pyrinomonadaceae bacterium]
MATYKYNNYVNQSDHAEFDKLHSPGEIAYNSGIYRCEGCGDEIAANKDNPLPPQNHHQHSTSQGKIRWKLTVFAVQN